LDIVIHTSIIGQQASRVNGKITLENTLAVET
jgi:hypothetical protein